MFHVSAHLEKQYDDWLEYRSDKGAMVAVCRCVHLKSSYIREFVSHNAVWTKSTLERVSNPVYCCINGIFRKLRHKSAI